MTQVPEIDYSSRSGRIARVIAYLCWIGAGAILSSHPSVLVSTGLFGIFVFAFSLFIFLGGVFSALGAITDRWIGEYVGLPLVISTMWVYGSLTLIAQPFLWTRVAFGLILISFGFKIIPRWRYIKRLVDANREKTKYEEDEGK